MNVCIPVMEDQGVQSRISAHFGSAPIFMLVDTETSECRAIENRNEHHAHGMCMPLASLQGEEIDGMVVGGIGMGAFNKLRAAGIKVYCGQFATVQDALTALHENQVEEMAPGMTCRGHG